MNTLRTLKSIHIYPIKSLRGIELSTSEIDEFSLKFDRRWMLVDDNNKFLSQREIPKLNQLEVAFSDDAIIVKQKNTTNSIKIPLKTTSKTTFKVNIWDEYIDAIHIQSQIDEWFSLILNTSCKLVYMPPTANRKVNPEYATNNEKTSFNDGFPFLIIGEESLNLLNSKLNVPILMNRFRPNFVFSGGQPHEEDTWNTFKIGASVFKRVKPCSRCIITTIDPVTSKIGKEPLRTLSLYRKKENKIYFGQNLLCVSGSQVTVGEPIVLIKD